MRVCFKRGHHAWLWMVFFCLLNSACGGGSTGSTGLNDPSAGTSASPAASLNLRVESDGFHPNKSSYNTVNAFEIVVSGEGLAMPIVNRYSADTTSAQIEGLPMGAVVDVEVKVYNQDGIVFKRAVTENIAIDDSIKEALLKVKYVPIFTNLRDGAHVRADRLRFVAYSHPDDALTLLAKDEGGGFFQLSDHSSKREFKPNDTTGLTDIRVDPLDPGPYTLTLRNGANGQESSISITILPAQEAEPLLLTSGSSLGSPRYQDDTFSTHFLEVLYDD